MSELQPAATDNWLKDVLSTLRQRWWLIAAITFVTFTAAVIYLQNARYLYTAQLQVYAAPSTSGPSQGTGALGGLASLAGIGPLGSEAATPFRLYLEGVRAREVAERMARDREIMRAVFAKEWDPATRSWRERRGLFGSIKHAVWNMLGLPLPRWQPPSAARLQDFINGGVSVTQSTKTPLVSITMQSGDPRFAVRFLTLLGITVDEYLREKQQQRVRNNIDYLSEKLRVVTLAEQRQALIFALNDQERQAMLANSRAPYAANPFGVAVASTSPTTPRQIPLLLAGIIGGLILGMSVAIVMGPRRPAAPPS